MTRLMKTGAALMLCLACWAAASSFGFGADETADVNRLRNDLRSKEPQTRQAAARMLAALGVKATAAVPDLVQVLQRDKDLDVYKEAVVALAKIGARDELEGEREGLRAFMEELDRQNEKRKEDIKNLEDLYKEAMNPPRIPGEPPPPPMLTSALGFKQLIAEARKQIGENLTQKGIARQKVAVIEATLRSVRD